MEKIWRDLCWDSQLVESPTWHEEILAVREQGIKAGESKFYSLKAAKNAIKDRIEK